MASGFLSFGCDCMAMRPLRPCAHVGCSNLVTSGYCEEHKKEVKKRYDQYRGSYRERGYTSSWDKLRKRYITQYPLCESCEAKGIYEIATVVHHKVPIQEGGELLDVNNLQSLCNRCHEDIHGKDRFKRK